jgi:3-carboxy-cis,cis-muconate cycloisomerase
MTLFEPLFGVPAVNAIFSPASAVQRMLDFEAALAQAEAEAGVIPATAAEQIRQHCDVEHFDLAVLATEAARAGNLAIPIIQHLTTLVAAVDPDASRYVHWGVTSQDMIDTALVLQLRDALALIDEDLSRLRRVTRHLVEQYRATPVVARTWMQHAVPTTLGLQVAGWLDALDRHAARLTDVRHRDVALQFGGAGGTLASFGGQGIDVGSILARRLAIPMPAVSWHAHRDRIASIAATLALLTGTLGKIARDLALQSQTEVAELAEPTEDGRGTSSSMPHKRNPVAAAVTLAAAVRVPALVGGVLTGMVQEHERGLGGWQAEWESVPEIVRLAAGALHHLLGALNGLAVDPVRMQANLEATGGLVYSESVTMALARHVGRSEARRIVEAATQLAMRERRHLKEILAADPIVLAHLTSRQLGELFESTPHAAVSQSLIDRVLQGDRDLGGARD